MSTVNMSTDAEIPQFSQQERERVAELQEIIDKPGISTNQRQIAEANLQALYKSKEPEPHKRSSRIREAEAAEAESRKDSNMFHNDEAFQRFEMGHQRSSPQGGHEEAVQNMYRSVKMNHKVRGTTKAAAEDEFHRS